MSENVKFSPDLYESTGLMTYHAEIDAESHQRPGTRRFSPARDYRPAPPDLTMWGLAQKMNRAIRVRSYGRENAIWAYSHFIAELNKQYLHIVKTGRIDISWSDRDPYKTSKEMRADVENGVLRVFKSSPDAFGPPDSTYQNDENHPLLGLSPYHSWGDPLTWNDIFRAVHDLWGHAVGGYEFGPRGEFNATLCHLSTFTHWAAREVLLSETLLQNAWFNYGPDSGAGQIDWEAGQPVWRPYAKTDRLYLPPARRPFAPQIAFSIPLYDYRDIPLCNFPLEENENEHA